MLLCNKSAFCAYLCSAQRPPTLILIEIVQAVGTSENLPDTCRNNTAFVGQNYNYNIIWLNDNACVNWCDNQLSIHKQCKIQVHSFKLIRGTISVMQYVNMSNPKQNKRELITDEAIYENNLFKILCISICCYSSETEFI